MGKHVKNNPVSVNRKKSYSKSDSVNVRLDGLLTYKHYLGSIEYDPVEKIFFGKVLYIRDTITFEAKNPEKLYLEFVNCIKHYTKICTAEGLEPNKPLNGVFNVRTSPEIHYLLSIASKKQNTSLNNIVNDAITLFLGKKGFSNL